MSIVKPLNITALLCCRASASWLLKADSCGMSTLKLMSLSTVAALQGQYYTGEAARLVGANGASSPLRPSLGFQMQGKPFS